MHSNAAERRITIRAQAAVLALLVQTLFISALWFAAVRQTERTSARETILFLTPPLPPAPRTIDARGGAPVGRAPSRAAPMPFSPVPFSPVPQPVPQADLRGFGRALFGCAPEHYAELLPEERAHCPKPGEGLAIDYQVIVEIRSFEVRVDGGDHAEVNLFVRILNDRNGEVRASKSFTATAPVSGSGNAAYVAALDSAFGDTAKQIVRWTDSLI